MTGDTRGLSVAGLSLSLACVLLSLPGSAARNQAGSGRSGAWVPRLTNTHSILPGDSVTKGFSAAVTEDFRGRLVAAQLRGRAYSPQVSSTTHTPVWNGVGSFLDVGNFLRRSLVNLWKTHQDKGPTSNAQSQDAATGAGVVTNADAGAGADTGPVAGTGTGSGRRTGPGADTGAGTAGTDTPTGTVTSAAAAAAAKQGLVYAPDAAALLKAKAAWTRGAATVDKNHYLDTWSSQKPCASWHGVECHPTTGRVVGVSLRGGGGSTSRPAFRLSGKVPPEIGSLAALETLVLTNHGLQGPLPRIITSLSRLTRLDLSRNAFGGASLPMEVGNWTALRRLDLSASGLSGLLPSALASLAQLTHLDLSGNALGGAIPQQMGNLTLLKELHLDNNRISGNLGGIRRMAKLAVLDVSNNLIGGSLPEEFGELKSLHSLNVAGNSIGGTLGIGLSSLVNVMDLRINNNRISGSIPSELWRLNLIADNNKLTGQLPGTFLTNQPSGSFAGNFLTGLCPYFNTTVGLCSPGGSECPHVLIDLRNRLLNNCLKHCVLGPKVGASQKAPSACARACGSDTHGGACNNWGSCEFVGPNQAPTCRCEITFTVTNPYYNPGTCHPDRYPNDPPPLPTRNFPKGVSFSQKHAPLGHLNRWSRYLSKGSQQQKLGQGQGQGGALGGVTWSLQASFNWGADPTFFGELPLTWGLLRDQGVCSCSWATASVDAIAAATTIASSKPAGKVPVLSVSQVLRCSSGGESGQCKGDLPVTALEYSANTGVLADASFKGNKTCASVSKVPPPVLMYEAVRFRGYMGLILTLQSQPVLVVIEASRALQRATCYDGTLVFQDPGCYTGNLDHTVLLVGYNIAFGTPFFTVRNSWGKDWCNGGYISMGIQGGPGVCGMNVLPAYYPIPAPPKGNPCYTNSTAGTASAMNPCGGGQCSPKPSWGSYSYTCKCPFGFITVNNTVRVSLPGAGKGVTQACVPIDACSATIESPCGVGTCVNDGRGRYNCLCPPGTHEGKFVDGQPTCSFGQGPKVLTLKAGVTCCLISATFQIPLRQLQKQNPKLNCNNLKPGALVNVSSPSYSCSSTYTVTNRYRTFLNISKSVLWPREPSSTYDTSDTPPPVDIKSLNPTADCGSLVPGQAICLRRGQWQRRVCSLRYTMQAGDTCQSMTGRFFRNPQGGTDSYPKERDPMPFFQMNPGLNCDLLAGVGESGNRSSAIGAQGASICISSSPQVTYGNSNPCPKPLVAYYLKQGDTCFELAAQKVRFHFQSVKHIEVLNSPISGLSCTERLKVGQLVCHPQG